MKKIYLIKNKELFQGEKYLNSDKNYFEGWYFKNTNNDTGISFIPGISISSDIKKSFIQIITNDSSYCVDYDIDDFVFNLEPFYIKIKDNYFSFDKLHIDINDVNQDINVYGDICYSNSINIKTNTINPNIMGPFSYVPFMECNHAIISIKNNVNGMIKINNEEIIFNNGIGYIEKDWGCSFPKTYLWCQANHFRNKDASFMFSVADIPFKIFSFKGFICVLMVNNKEYKFTTYNGAKIVKYDVNKEFINITIKKSNYYLDIKTLNKIGYKLSAPVKGKMDKDVFETISAVINVTLRKNQDIIFSDESINCGLEIV